MTENIQQATHGDAISTIIKVLEQVDESGRERVLAAVHAYFRSSSSPNGGGTQLPEQNHSLIQMDIRTLREKKKPKTDIEMAALMAYYLKEFAPATERKDIVTAQDVESYFNQAGHPLPKHFRMTLTNAKNAGYFNAVGEGQFKLNPVGHNLVAHSLPRASKEGKLRAKRKKRSAAKRKNKK